MKQTITEILRKRINKIIIEDYGINLELDNVASSTSKKIISNLNGKYFVKRDDGQFVKEHTEIVQINNKTIKIFVTNFWFKTKTNKNNFLKTHVIYNGFIFETNWILITLFDIGSKKFSEEDLNDTLYHELEHAFQTSKMQHNFGSPTIYAIAKTNIFSSDKISKSLAEIIYASTKNEQDAMINGLYGSLKNYNFIEIDKKIKKSEAYIWYKKLFLAYLTINSLDEKQLQQYLLPYNKTKKWFLTIAKKGIKRFERKLARTVFKLKYNNIKEGRFKPNILAENKMLEGQLFWLN